MALTESRDIKLRTKAPNFNLLNTVSLTKQSLDQLQGDKGTVIMFICNHCPYVKFINNQIISLANDYQNKGINFIAISSNNIETHPQDSPKMMKLVAEKLSYPFPYLYDETQEIAKAYDAVCTPDFFLFDKNLELFYHGRLDESTPGNNKLQTGFELINAMESLLSDKVPPKNQYPSIGCGIKWK
jgi:thiol-disulfide isomerase/thioredoxin